MRKHIVKNTNENPLHDWDECRAKEREGTKKSIFLNPMVSTSELQPK